MTQSGHERLSIAAVQPDPCTPFRRSQNPAVIESLEAIVEPGNATTDRIKQPDFGHRHIGGLMYRGGCSCGSVRFELDGEPLWVLACHCGACKKRTGSAYGVSVMVETKNVKQFTGDIRTYTRVGDSGNKVHYDFCPSCGTTLRWRIDVVPGRQAFAGGSFDNANVLQPVAEMYTDDAIPWARLNCALSRPKAPDDAFRNAMIAASRASRQ